MLKTSTLSTKPQYLLQAVSFGQLQLISVLNPYLSNYLSITPVEARTISKKQIPD